MYQPAITRLPSLLALFLITLVLIGMTEYAVRHYPAYNKAGIVHSVSQESLGEAPARLLVRQAQGTTPTTGDTPPPGNSPAEAGTGASTGSTGGAGGGAGTDAGTSPGTGTDTGTTPGAGTGTDNTGGNPPTGGTPTNPENPTPGGGGSKTGPTIAPNPDKFQPVGDDPPKSDPPKNDPPSNDPPGNTTPDPPGNGGDTGQDTPPKTPQQTAPADDAFQGVGNKKPSDSGSAPPVQIIPGTGEKDQGVGDKNAGVDVQVGGQSGQQPAGQQPGQQGSPAGQNGNQPGVNVPGSNPAAPGAAAQGGNPAATPVIDAAGNTIAAGVAATVGSDGQQTPVATVGADGKSTPVAAAAGGSVTAFTTGTAVGEAFTIGPSGVVVVDGTTFNTATPTVATLKNGKTVTVGPSGAVAIQDQSPEMKANQNISRRDYVIGCFLPTILAVLFTIPWHILASAIKEMEPFYQLHKDEGATAGKSFALTYRASINIVSTINAIRNGHFLVWWSGFVSLVVLILAPLSSETVFLAYVGPKSCDPLNGRESCIPQLSVYPVAARIVQGLLSFVAVLTFGLIIILLKARTGLFANPLSIATMASLFQDQSAIDDFRRIRGYHPPEAKDIKEALGDSRYRIGQYTDSLGNPRYGLHALSPLPAQAEEINIQRASGVFGSQKYSSVAVREQAVDDETSSRRHHIEPKKRRAWFTYGTHSITVLVFSAFVLALMFLIIYYNRFHTTRAFEKFMTEGSFGVNFLFTSLGVLIKMYWTMLDDDLRLHTPYALLSTGAQPAQHTLLSTPHNNPFTGLFHSLSHTQFLNALTSLIAILCEPLIVCLANVPFKPTLSFKAYIVSTWLSVAILALMLLCVACLLVKRARSGEGFMGRSNGEGVGAGRAPDTVGGVLWLMCGSRMLGDFGGEGGGERRQSGGGGWDDSGWDTSRKDMSEMTESEIKERVSQWGKLYALGAVVGVDGEERLGVDESLFVREQEEED